MHNHWDAVATKDDILFNIVGAHDVRSSYCQQRVLG